jgi:RNA-directed DNA polymerase
VRRLTNRNWGVSMRYQFFKLIQYVRGWIKDFGIASDYQRCLELDHWIRRRVKMAYWRQWRKPRTKVNNLLKLGANIYAAVASGTSSKEPWRSAKSSGINQALSLDNLKSEGLYSLRDDWISLHHSK